MTHVMVGWSDVLMMNVLSAEPIAVEDANQSSFNLMEHKYAVQRILVSGIVEVYN